MKRNSTGRFLAVAVALASIFLSGLALTLHGRTVVDVRISVVAGAGAAVVVSILLRRAVCALSGENRMAGFILTAVFVFSLGTGLFYAVNYYGSDKDSAVKHQAEVTRKFTEEHYQVRRVSRNRAVRGRKYKVYRIDVALPGGHVKRIDVPAGRYSKIKKGGKLELSVEKGFFGVPVIKGIEFPVYKYERSD